MVHIYSGLIFIISFLIFIYVFTLLHEVLHGIGCRFMGIPFKIKITILQGVTQINDKHLTDHTFTFIALSPYFVLFPLFAWFYQFDNFIVSFCGMVGLVWHGLNLPMEFVIYVIGRKRIKKDKEDGSKAPYSFTA